MRARHGRLLRLQFGRDYAAPAIVLHRRRKIERRHPKGRAHLHHRARAHCADQHITKARFLRFQRHQLVAPKRAAGFDLTWAARNAAKPVVADETRKRRILRRAGSMKLCQQRLDAHIAIQRIHRGTQRKRPVQLVAAPV